MNYLKSSDKKLTEQFGSEHLKHIINSSIVSLIFRRGLSFELVIGYFTMHNCLSILNSFLRPKIIMF